MPFYIHSLSANQSIHGIPLIGIFHDKLYEQPMMWLRLIGPHVMLEFTKGPVQRESTLHDYRAALAWVQSMFYHPKRDPIAYFDRISAMTANHDRALQPDELHVEGPYMLADETWVCPGCQHFCEEPVGEDLCLHPESKVKPGHVHGGVKPFTCPYFPDPIPR